MQGFSLDELARRLGGELTGDGRLRLSGVAGLAEAGPADLSFYGNARYRKQLASTRAGAVLVNARPSERPELPCIQVPNPHLAFARASQLFHPVKAHAPGLSERAFVHPEATVAPSATVMPFAVVERGATVARGAVLYPGVFVGEGASIGEGSVLHAGVCVREGCLVGARVILHAGVVVGADGFGFALDMEVPEHVKIPQAGIVRIEDDVEIGANSCIDRATVGETVIGKGTKIDNLVQIAHNVRVGPLSILCAQAGVSGSAELGTGVVLAGQVGVVGHIRIGDLAKVGAQSGVAHPVPDGAIVSGSPAMDHRDWLKLSAAQKDLSDLMKEVRTLRKKVEALEKEGTR